MIAIVTPSDVPRDCKFGSVKKAGGYWFNFFVSPLPTVIIGGSWLAAQDGQFETDDASLTSDPRECRSAVTGNS